MPVAKKNALNSGPGEAAAAAGNVIPARFAAEPKTQDTPTSLGQRLKRMRLDKGWTLEDMSQKTDVARSTLSKIENGQMSPTYDVLQRISSGSNFDLVELFDVRRQNVPFGRRSVTRKGQGKLYPTSTYGYEVLSTDLSQKQILPFKARISARSLDDFSGWVRHDGEEFLCVLSGQVQVFTEFYAPVVLDVGDSMYFDSKMGHAVVSMSEDDAEILWVCTGVTAFE
jgi:transcriptional regulator with XRE-family HTH domain